MIQGSCRLWNLSIASVVLLTFSNIILTVKLLHSSNCGGAADPPPPGDAPLGEPPPHQAPPRDGQPAAPAMAQAAQQAPPPPPAPRAPSPPRRQQEPPPPRVETAFPEPCRPAPALPPNSTAASSVFRFNLKLGRWDSRRLYKMFDHVIVGERFAELSDLFSVSLATQSSVDKLKSLVQVAHHWAGPISVALYAAGDEYTLLQVYVAYLRRCFAAVRERVSFHLAFPRDRMPRQSAVDAVAAAVVEPPAHPKTECLRPESALAELLSVRRPETFTYLGRAPYPQNHMRNLARRNCQTPYVFLTDVDIIPSAFFAEGLDVFLKGARCDGLCAYVIPTYELHDQVRFPRNKTDLVRLAKRGLARPFHQKVFIYNQYATNFSRWQASAETESSAVHISHKVTNFEFLYEPFYVAPDTVPAHDERFMGYGYTRNTQVYEMYVAGYQFHVLSPIFTCHWGLQPKKQRPSWRERQNSNNGHLFEQFKKEIFARYPKETQQRPRSPLGGDGVPRLGVGPRAPLPGVPGPPRGPRPAPPQPPQPV